VCLSQRADGAGWSLVVAGMQVALNGLIFGFAVWRGVGGVSFTDRLMLAIAAGGALGWVIAGDPFVATVCVVAADLLGLAMMLPRRTATPSRRRSPRSRSPR
jgi:uncharacterized membrane protein